MEGKAITEYASLSGKIHTLVIDKTLKISGACADAKATGERLEKCESIVEETKEIAKEVAKEGLDEVLTESDPNDFNAAARNLYNVSNADMKAKVEAAGFGDSVAIDLLWTNANPESEFAAQTVSLDLSAYDFVMVYFKSNTHTTHGNSDAHLVPKGYTCSGVAFGGNDGHRTFYATDTGVHFGDGERLSDLANSDSYCVPLYIYGIKKARYGEVSDDDETGGEVGDLTAEDIGALPARPGTNYGVYWLDDTYKLNINGEGVGKSLGSIGVTSEEIQLCTREKNGAKARILKLYHDGHAKVQNSLKVVDTDGTEYAVYGEHNKPTPAGIGAASAEDVTELQERTIKYIPNAELKVSKNVLTDNIMTLGAGWSGNLTDGFTHAAGKTEPLTFAINAADGESYFIEADCTNTGDTIVHLSIGDSFLTDPYDGSNQICWGVTCVNGGSLVITPQSSFSGYIRNLTCKKVSEDGTEEIAVLIEGIDTENQESRLCGRWNVNIGSMNQKMVNGTRNISIGRDALRELVTGGRNIGVGTYALQILQTGENNLSIGADSCYQMAGGDNNIAIGKTAMGFGANLKNNIAIGYQALRGTPESTAESNIAIGENAGFNSTGKSAVLIGTNAGYKSTGAMNVFIGQNAGANATSWGCTAIGSQAETGVYSQSIAIGYQAKATKSKQVVLGGDSITETVLNGDVVVRGTDGVKRKLTFNADGTCSWAAVT